MSKCPTCGGSGTFYAATESVWQDWKRGNTHMYTVQACPCTPRVVPVRVARDVVAHGQVASLRRAAVPFAVADATIQKGKCDGK